MPQATSSSPPPSSVILPDIPALPKVQDDAKAAPKITSCMRLLIPRYDPKIKQHAKALFLPSKAVSKEGRDLLFMLERNWSITAVGIHPETEAQYQDGPISFLPAEVLSEGLGENVFDVILAPNKFHFQDASTLRKTLENIAHSLSEGGYACATFHGPDHSWRFDPRFQKLHFHAAKDVRQMIEDINQSMPKGKKLIIDELTIDEKKNYRSSGGEIVENWQELRLVFHKGAPPPKAGGVSGFLKRMRLDSSAPLVLDVRYFSQVDTHEKHGCWFAALKSMRAWAGIDSEYDYSDDERFWEDGTRKGLERKHWPSVIEKEGLVVVERCNQEDYLFQIDELRSMLQQRGPIMFSHVRTSTVNHSMILHGIDPNANENEVIIYNDPARGENQRMSIEKFNDGLSRHDYSMVQFAAVKQDNLRKFVKKIGDIF